MTVDYMTRFMMGASLSEAFKISIVGSSIIRKKDTALNLLENVKGLDDNSIISALKLSGFDVCYRSDPMFYKPIEEINPNKKTVENIKTMVENSLNFFKIYGPKLLDGFTFDGGYTNIVCTGDGDFITKDTLWDFKVSKNDIKKEHTLQLLMYWRMGLHSIHEEFQNIKYLGIYNPRQNKVYRINVKNIPNDVILEVENKVIGYK